MGIFDRLHTVLRSNLNAMVDRVEDPEKLIHQTVVDMKDELRRARAELVTTLATSKRLEKKKLELEAEAASWEEKAVIAIRAGDDSLAREALKRKTRVAAEAIETGRRATEQAAAADEMQSTLDRIEKKLSDLEARKTTLAAQVRKAREAPKGERGSPEGSAFDELDRMTSRIDQLDAEVEAHAILDDPARSAVDAEFRALEKARGDTAVEDELATLKKRLGGS